MLFTGFGFVFSCCLVDWLRVGVFWLVLFGCVFIWLAFKCSCLFSEKVQRVRKHIQLSNKAVWYIIDVFFSSPPEKKREICGNET